MPTLKVELSYFKATSGKWYSDAEMTTEREHLFETWRDVQELLDQRRLPGLITGHSDYFVLVNVPDHKFALPALILPSFIRTT